MVIFFGGTSFLMSGAIALGAFLIDRLEVKLFKNADIGILIAIHGAYLIYLYFFWGP